MMSVAYNPLMSVERFHSSTNPTKTGIICYMISSEVHEPVLYHTMPWDPLYDSHMDLMKSVAGVMSMVTISLIPMIQHWEMSFLMKQSLPDPFVSWFGNRLVKFVERFKNEKEMNLVYCRILAVVEMQQPQIINWLELDLIQRKAPEPENYGGFAYMISSISVVLLFLLVWLGWYLSSTTEFG